MSELTYPATRGRALRGLGTGVLAALVVSSLLSALFISQWDEDQPQSISEFLGDILALDVVLFPAYSGVLLVGSAIWLGLYRAGLRGWGGASALGFGLSFLPAFLWIWHFQSLPITRIGGFAVGGTIFGVGGLVVATAAWCAAYRVAVNKRLT